MKNYEGNKRISYKKILSMLLALVIASSVFSPMEGLAAGKEDAEIIRLGDTIRGVGAGAGHWMKATGDIFPNGY